MNDLPEVDEAGIELADAFARPETVDAMIQHAHKTRSWFGCEFDSGHRFVSVYSHALAAHQCPGGSTTRKRCNEAFVNLSE